MIRPNRRHVLQTGLAAAAVWPLLGSVRAASFDSDPFKLGVASGCPRPTSVVLWTRLVFSMPGEVVWGSDPFGLSPATDTPEPTYDVEWQIAEDEGFSRILVSGIASAKPELAHSVHVLVENLSPDRWYFYRFRVGDAESEIGRTRTAPAIDADRPFRFAFASCQQYEQGFYAPYADMAGRELDLVVHLGDYIYEMSWGGGHVREHGSGAPSLLYEYRDRYALYKADKNLKAAHAAFPWIVTWDDHEVYNNYQLRGAASETEKRAFLDRRRAAYQAWFEHMPVPPAMGRDFSAMRIYDRYRFGQMLDMAVLDLRQYRTPMGPDGRPPQDANLLGEEQTQWLEDSLAEADSRWTIIAQQTLLSERDLADGAATSYSADTWDGYRQSRRHLLETLERTRPQNPLVIGGDLHAYYAADVKSDFTDPDAPAVATEFVTGAISSDGPTEASVATAQAENPHLRYVSGDHGYAMVELDARRAEVDFMVVSDRKDPDATTTRKKRFAVVDGQPGVNTVE